LEKVLTGSDFAARLVEKGYRYAREMFDAEKVTREVVEVYEM